jgi:hypothetical protein
VQIASRARSAARATFTPPAARPSPPRGAHEITASYGGDLGHGMSKGSAIVNATAAVCTPGDNDDNNGGGDDDENDGQPGAKSKLALSGFSQLLLNSVQSDECDNDQNDQNGDQDGSGSDGD